MSSKTTGNPEILAGIKERENGDAARTLTSRSHDSGKGEAITDSENTNNAHGTNTV